MLLCVNPCNRGGVYPAPERVQNLGIDIHEEGEDESDANHNGVCVEDLPATEQERGYVSMLQHNKNKVAGTMLEVCFSSSSAIYGTLSHSHLLLVLLSWLCGAKWNVPAVAVNGKKDWSRLVDREGCLLLESLPDGDILKKLCKDGLDMEILSYKLETENPGASSKISQALNKGNALALKTSEMTAIAVLTGAVSTQADANLSGEVLFESIKDKLRAELDIFVDEPEFIEMFEFVVTQGANRNTFIPRLLDFGARFLDGMNRKLRLNAFSLVNKLGDGLPRCKNGILMRAYRQKPSQTYVPTPEASWARQSRPDLEKLEALLYFFEVLCKPTLERLSDQERAELLANTAVAATDAFISRKSKDNVQQVLLVAT